MSQCDKQRYESRGIEPPEFLASWVRSEIIRVGDLEMVRRLGLSRIPLNRLAARLPVNRGSIALAQADHDREHATGRAA